MRSRSFHNSHEVTNGRSSPVVLSVNYAIKVCVQHLKIPPTKSEDGETRPEDRTKISRCGPKWAVCMEMVRPKCLLLFCSAPDSSRHRGSKTTSMACGIVFTGSRAYLVIYFGVWYNLCEFPCIQICFVFVCMCFCMIKYSIF